MDAPEIPTAGDPVTARRLTAIFAADIAGYSALMGADDVETLADLKGHQSVILPMIAGFGGRVIDTAGDGILAEFSSVLNAVKCAIAVQEVMRERNASVLPARRMHYRIGINQGDVLFDNDRIYGDGINVAARLEGLCEPGGICVSSKVYDEVKDRFDVNFQDIGEQRLKNIALPVRTYRIRVSKSDSPHSAGSTGAIIPRAPGSRRWIVGLAGVTVVVSAVAAAWLVNGRLSEERKVDTESARQRLPTTPKVDTAPASAPIKTTMGTRDSDQEQKAPPGTELDAKKVHERELRTNIQDRVPTDLETLSKENAQTKKSASADPDPIARQEPAGPVANAKVPRFDQLPVATLEGVWEFITAGNEHCASKSRTFRLILKDGNVYNGQKKLGEFQADGKFTFSAPGPLNPNVVVYSQGQVKDGVGSGKFKGTPGKCLGTYEIRWLGLPP